MPYVMPQEQEIAKLEDRARMLENALEEVQEAAGRTQEG
jgi:nicotinic acid mononucleotide adenylyltransferase